MQLSDAQQGFCAMLDISAAHEALPFTRMVPDVHACPLFGDYPIPADTYRAAHAAHPMGTRCLQLREHFGMLFDNQHFAHLYAHAGKPALAPARLAVVTILQFMDDLSDTQAAEAVRDRISWKYLLGLPLDDPGFDARS